MFAFIEKLAPTVIAIEAAVPATIVRGCCNRSGIR